MRLRVLATIGLFSGLIGLANTQGAVIFDSFGSGITTDSQAYDVVYPDAIQHASDSLVNSGGLKVAYEFTPTSTSGPGTYDIAAAIFTAPAGSIGDLVPYNNPGGASAVTLEIVNNSSGAPGSTAISSTTSAIPTQDFSRTDSSKLLNASVNVTGTLTSGTLYWLVISYADSGNVARSWEGTGAGTSSYAYWRGDTSGNNVTWNVHSGAVGAFSITPVPEPQAYAIMAGLALLGFGVFRRFYPKAA